MPLDPWEREAAEAQSAQELLNLARELIATFTPAEMASIPEACRPTRIKGIDDLHHWQRCLAEAYCDAAPAAPRAPPTAACSRS